MAHRQYFQLLLSDRKSYIDLLVLGRWPIYCVICSAAMHQRLSTQAKTRFRWHLRHLPASCMASCAKPILASSAANWAFSQEPSCNNVKAADMQKHAKNTCRRKYCVNIRTTHAESSQGPMGHEGHTETFHRKVKVSLRVCRLWRLCNLWHLQSGFRSCFSCQCSSKPSLHPSYHALPSLQVHVVRRPTPLMLWLT